MGLFNNDAWRKIERFYSEHTEVTFLPGRKNFASFAEFYMKLFDKPNKKSIKKRIPFFAIGLLVLLFGLNIGSSLSQRFASAQSATAKTQNQAQEPYTVQDRQTIINANGQQVQVDEAGKLRQQEQMVAQIEQKEQKNAQKNTITQAKKALDDAPSMCRATVDGLNESFETLLMTVIYPAGSYTTPTPSSSTITINPTGTATTITTTNSNSTGNVDPTVPPTDEASVNALCVSAFEDGVVRPSDGQLVTIVAITYIQNQGTAGGSFSGATECSSTSYYTIHGYAGSNNTQYCISTSTNSNWIFPCSDKNTGGINEATISTDWLSGDIGNTNAKDSGHFLYTPLTEPGLFPAMQMLGLAIIAPAIIMIGLQLAVGMSSFRMANAMEGISRIILSAVLIFVCYEAIQIIVGISNTICQSIVNLHGNMAYPTVQTYTDTSPDNPNATGTVTFGYTVDGENDPYSYRGIIIPMSRWGCTANTFMGILGDKLAGDIAGMIPIIGNFIKAAVSIKTAIDLLKDSGQFIQTILSVMLAVQIIIRLVALNFYIMMAPLAFGCWGLPGGIGQNVVKSWFKGFLSLLGVQIIQVFLITIIPTLIPNPLPAFPTDSFHVLDSFVNMLPPIAVLWAVLRVPKMMGTTATSMMASAGQMAGGAIVAVGAAAYNIV